MFTSLKDWKNHKNKLNENNNTNEFTDNEAELLMNAGFDEAYPNNYFKDDITILKENGIVYLFISEDGERISTSGVEDALSKIDNDSDLNTNLPDSIQEIYDIIKNSPNFSEVILKDNNDEYDNSEYISIFSKLKSLNMHHPDELDEYDLGFVDGVLELHYIPNGHTQEIKSIDDLYMITRALTTDESKVNEANGSFTKLKFNSNTWHNKECDILEGHLDSDSFITYGIYVKDSASGKHKVGDEFMEYYKGENYVVGSKSRPHSRAFGVENIPAKYKAKWNELKAIYEEKYKGKEHVKESKIFNEAYVFDFEDFMDTDIAGPAIEGRIIDLIDETIDLVNKEINEMGAGTGADLDATKKQAYKEIARVWKNKIDDYLIKGIKFNQ